MNEILLMCFNFKIQLCLLSRKTRSYLLVLHQTAEMLYSTSFKTENKHYTNHNYVR